MDGKTMITAEWLRENSYTGTIGEDVVINNIPHRIVGYDACVDCYIMQDKHVELEIMVKNIIDNRDKIDND
jgi:hypothetical protein